MKKQGHDPTFDTQFIMILVYARATLALYFLIIIIIIIFDWKIISLSLYLLKRNEKSVYLDTRLSQWGHSMGVGASQKGVKPVRVFSRTTTCKKKSWSKIRWKTFEFNARYRILLDQLLILWILCLKKMSFFVEISLLSRWIFIIYESHIMIYWIILPSNARDGPSGHPRSLFSFKMSRFIQVFVYEMLVKIVLKKEFLIQKLFEDMGHVWWVR